MYKWSDQIGSRGRGAWLLLVDGEGHIHHFDGDNIPGVVAIIGYDYERAGKWSHTTYRLQLAHGGVRAIAGRNGWETGRFVEGLRSAVSYRQPIDRWVDVANALGVTMTEAQRFLREWRLKAAEALDLVEETLGLMDDETDGEFETVAISFGSPTNRMRAAGFWGWPVRVTLEGAEVGRVISGETDWVPEGQVKVLAVEHGSGRGGGYVSMRLAIPAGAKVYHGEVF